MAIRNLLLAGAGGFAGAVLRYKLGGLILHRTMGWKFPASTFAVNVAGCLAAGILMGLAVKQEIFSEPVRVLLFTGILGGFTTFSAFGVDTVFLLQERQVLWALAYVLSTVSIGILALYLGMTAIR